MKKLLISLSLTALLASCGATTPTAPVPAPAPPQTEGKPAAEQPFSKELTAPRDQIDVELLAQYLYAPGMTLEDVRQAKALRAEAETAQIQGLSLSQQDIAAIQQHDAAVNAAYDLILSGQVSQSSMDAAMGPLFSTRQLHFFPVQNSIEAV